MKKTKWIKLYLESLENRVVPSNTQIVLDPHHAMGVDSAIVAELTETPKVEIDTHDVSVSQSNSAHPASDDMTSSASTTGEHHEQSETENPIDTGHTAEAKKASDSESDTSAVSTSSNSIPSSIDAVEDRLSGSVKSDVSKKANLDSDGGNSKSQSENNPSIDKVEDTTSSSLVENVRGNGPKSDANEDSGNNGNGSKAVSSSSANSSSESSHSNSSSSADNDSNSATNAISTALVETFSSSLSLKLAHAKSQSDHRDSSTNSSSTEMASQTASTLSSMSPEGITEQVTAEPRLASALSETNSVRTSGESAASPVTSPPAIGLSLGLEGNTASIATVATALSAKGAVTQLPAVADAAIPLAVPALESVAANLGLGEWAAVDSLAPVASDLIVGFLPVEELSLAASMQGVLDQIDKLGEQIVGSSAGKWLYPIVFTALAATTVLHLASRRRRQFQRQSVWASESGIWSPTYFGHSAQK